MPLSRAGVYKNVQECTECWALQVLPHFMLFHVVEFLEAHTCFLFSPLVLATQPLKIVILKKGNQTSQK